MNASTSSPPPSSSTLAASEIARPRKRNFAFWRPVLACGGALLGGALLIRLFPAPTTGASALAPVEPAAPMRIAASQLVTARLAPPPGAPGRTMSGRWKLTTDATGRAPVGGEVARWVVEPGAHVEAGERVIEISSGVASRPAPRAEARQSDAEREQVEAAHGQSALAQNLSASQIELVNAQERVAKAQERVASARSLVKRLLAGEKIPAEGTGVKPVGRRIVRSRPVTRHVREEGRAQGAANEAKSRAKAAKSEDGDAQSALTKAQKQSTATAATLSKAESDFKLEKITADVLQNARADADDAQATLKAAQTRADVADKTLAIQKSKAKAADAVAAPPVATVAPVPEAPPPTDTEDAGRYLSVDQAATLVASALRESRAAARQAERVHARVDDTQRQAKLVGRQVESASKDMQRAQQSVIESVPRPMFTASRAPVAGTITWISRLAREVGTGQAVFGISRGKNGFVRFEDQSGAWQKLRVGQTLSAATPSNELAAPPPNMATPASTATPASPAMPSTGSASPAMPSSGSASSPMPSKDPSNPALDAPDKSVSLPPVPTFSIRITRISPPDAPGQPAQIDAVRGDGSAPVDGGASGVQAALPADVLPPVAPDPSHPAAARPVVVPMSVILPRDGASYVAVVASVTGAEQPSLQWRLVEIEGQTAFDVEIKSGLRAGERVVSQPALLLSGCKPEEKKSLPVAIDALD